MFGMANQIVYWRRYKSHAVITNIFSVVFCFVLFWETGKTTPNFPFNISGTYNNRNCIQNRMEFV